MDIILGKAYKVEYTAFDLGNKDINIDPEKFGARVVGIDSLLDYLEDQKLVPSVTSDDGFNAIVDIIDKHGKRVLQLIDNDAPHIWDFRLIKNKLVAIHDYDWYGAYMTLPQFRKLVAYLEKHAEVGDFKLTPTNPR